MNELSYAVITPTRDEADNLERLAACLADQTVQPEAWLIVDTGSADGTIALASRLAAEESWIQLERIAGDVGTIRGAPVVRAFHRGLDSLRKPTDVVVKVDADVSMGSDYFERLLGEFARNPKLGIASGRAYEERDGLWQPQHVTRTSVWGASRAYRWECLKDVSPLEERMGWDGIDEVKANVLGWQTRTITALRFDHHRREGDRDGSRSRAWEAQGKLAHYLGYRVSYLTLRSLHRARSEPAALAILFGYAKAALHREPTHPDPTVRRYLRRKQRLRELPLRVREALGRSPR